VICACLSAYLYSCAASLPKNADDNAPDAEVTLGPVFKVSDIPVKKFSAVSDNEGQIHILAVSKRPKNLQYLTINKGAVHNLKIIDANRFLEDLSWGDFGSGLFDLDVALDHKSRLHAVIGSSKNDHDRNHLIFEKGEWQELSKVRCEKIVRCCEDLICGFISGKKDLTRFGGGDTGIGKLVVAQGVDNEWSDWTVFDYTMPLRTYEFSIATDKFCNFYISYGRIFKESIFSFKSTNIDLAYSKIRQSTYLNREHDITVPKRPTSVSGMGILKGLALWFDITVDADSGDGIIASEEGYINISEGDRVSYPIQFIGGRLRAIQMAPAGNGRFHAIISGLPDLMQSKLAYIQYYENAWSKPIELGEIRWANIFDIISVGSGNAIAVWINKDDYLVGRWIKIK
jgi:hypothetical protein